MCVIASCSLAYLVLAISVPQHGIAPMNFASATDMIITSVYFSVITATTIGYGDTVPLGFSRIIVMIESVVSLFLWAVFISKLVMHKQEIALYQVHTMSFETMFLKTRESLFIVRKDFEQIIDDVKKTKKLHVRSRQNMITACKQAHIVLEEIEKFYGGDSHTYTIDPKREELLLEAVRRTLERLKSLLSTLNACGIDINAYPEIERELTGFIAVVNVTLPLWREISHYEEHDILNDIEALNLAIIAEKM